MRRTAKAEVGLDGIAKRERARGRKGAPLPERQDERKEGGGGWERMRWWHEARFGMLLVYGLYSHPSFLGAEDMYWAKMPVRRYAKLTREFRPRPDAAQLWAALAKKAGMRYVVITAKHDDGYCLWDSCQTEFNSVRTGPKRDLVRECVEACRQEGAQGRHLLLPERVEASRLRARGAEQAGAPALPGLRARLHTRADDQLREDRRFLAGLPGSHEDARTLGEPQDRGDGARASAGHRHQ